jgi:hypothetical protein
MKKSLCAGLLLAGMMLLTVIPAVAQHECDTIPANTIQTATDASGVLHQIECWNPATGKVTFPSQSSGSGVTSFNTRTGAVTPANGDYTCSQVTGCSLAVLAQINFVNQTGTFGESIYTPTSAGMYKVSLYLAQSGGGCTSVGSGSVAVTLSYTDDVGSVSAAPFQTMALTTTVPNNTITANPSLSELSLYSASGSAISFAVTFTQCATGSTTYNIHMTVTPG